MNTLQRIIESKNTLVLEPYNELEAVDYDRTFKNSSDDLFFISGFVQSLSSGRSDILILGAGTGDWALTLAKQGHRVTAVDSSADMLNILRDKVDFLGLEIEIVLSDMSEYNSGRDFNFIFLPNNSIMHLDYGQLCKTFNLCNRQLRSGGALYFDHFINPTTKDLPDLKYIGPLPGNTGSYEMSLVDVQHKSQKAIEVSHIHLTLKKDGTYTTRYAKTDQAIFTARELVGALKTAGFDQITLNPHYIMHDTFIYFEYPTASVIVFKD